MKDFLGYEWGWITDQGLREEKPVAIPSNIIGVWGKVRRHDKDNTYHETFLQEYAKEGVKNSWTERPL